jgi:quinol monooxygenase YgiN
MERYADRAAVEAHRATDCSALGRKMGEFMRGVRNPPEVEVVAQPPASFTV